MVLIRIADILIVLVQNYMIYNFMYKIWKPKYGYIASNLLTLAAEAVLYVNGVYVMTSAPMPIRYVLGIGVMILYAVFALEGTVFQNIKRGILYYIALGALEIGTLFCCLSWLPIAYVKVVFTTNLVIGRVIYTFVAYFFIMVIQLVINWKKSRELKLLVGISAILVVCELIFLVMLFYSVSENGTKYIVMISAFASALVMLGYYLMTEMFYLIIRQQEKKSELEQERLEQKYQYDYYMLAREQGESARDLRHDMRNQLQTVQYLMQAENEEDRRRAEEMLEKLRRKIEQII